MSLIVIVRELANDSPTLPLELNGPGVQLKNPQPECSMTASNVSAFSMCWQSPAYPASPALAKHP